MSFPTVAARFAQALTALNNCVKSGNTDWAAKWRDKLAELERDYLPSGSGVDNGVAFDRSRSTEQCLVFTTAFHHMDENGFYDNWTEHTIRVRPSFSNDLDISVSGRDRNDIKEHLRSLMHESLIVAVSDAEFVPKRRVG
jgi:hypothetical protein